MQGKCLLHEKKRYGARMEPCQRLKQAREAAGFESASEAATALGVALSTYTQHENGTRGIPKARAKQYAQRFGTSPEWLLFGRGEATKAAPIPIRRLIPVLGGVQAGAWTAIPEQEQEPESMIPMVLPAYEAANLYALRVIGPSMNLHYPEGTLVIVCPAAEAGIREGDHVIVRRERPGEVETTIKEVVQERDGIALWPRSTDPAHKRPIMLKSEPDADNGVEIIGVVVASYIVRPPQQRPLIRL